MPKHAEKIRFHYYEAKSMISDVTVMCDLCHDLVFVQELKASNEEEIVRLAFEMMIFHAFAIHGIHYQYVGTFSQFKKGWNRVSKS